MRLLIFFILVFMFVWADSFIGTTDVTNWFIENTLTVISLLFLTLTYQTYRFSNLSYLFICIFLCVHVYGSKYTYAENTFGFWLQDAFDSSRNHYDRLVHFSFGLLLFYPLQECFSKWLKFDARERYMLPILIVLGASALYEIIEWLVADIFFSHQGMAYLGTQGDIWDAQKDTALAFLGVTVAAICFYMLNQIQCAKPNKRY